MKSIMTNFIMMLVSVCIALLIGEALIVLKNKDMQNYQIEIWRYAKIFKKTSDDPVIGHEHRPNQSAVVESVNIRTNNFGLRGPDINIEASAQRRLLFLGSSMTLGWGVPEDKTLVSVLQRRLGPDFEVLNAGVANYNTTRYVQLYLKKLAVLRPTDIVIHYYINDAEVLSPARKNWILHNSQFALTLYNLGHELFAKNSAEGMLDFYRKLYQPDSQGFVAMLNALDKLKNHANKNNIQVYFLMTPDFSDIVNYKYGFIHRLMKREAEARNFIYVDPLPVFSDVTDSSSLWATSSDHHANAVAQKRMADYFFEHSGLQNQTRIIDADRQ